MADGSVPSSQFRDLGLAFLCHVLGLADPGPICGFNCWQLSERAAQLWPLLHVCNLEFRGRKLKFDSLSPLLYPFF